MDPVLEGLVTTVDPDGGLHLARMGPRMHPDGKHMVLRPFPGSQTLRNLKARREGVVHITDDVLLLAKAALGQAGKPSHRRSERVHGYVLLDACRFLEFVVHKIDESGERARLDAEVVHSGTFRDFWGFNRAKHAVLEATILATRLHLLKLDEVANEFGMLRVIVDKTGGPAERDAFTLVQAHFDQFCRERRQK